MLKRPTKMTRRLVRFALLTVGLGTVGFVASCQENAYQAGASQTGEEASIKSGWSVQTAYEAIEHVLEILGAPRELAPSATATFVTVETDDTPFLHKEIVGRQLWHVVVSNWKLELESAGPGFEDAYERTFDVLLDPENGNVLKVASRWPAGVSGEPRYPPAQSAEEEMKGSAEEYHSFPEERPAITFRQALDVVLGPGVGNPLVAKRISGTYVVQSSKPRERRPVWAITLDGISWRLPSYPGLGPRFANRMRNIVDARTGEWLAATNIPQLISEGASSSPPRQPPGNDPPPGDFP